MSKTLILSFSLKNTYRVNSILYSLKQIPILKRILPDTLYQERGLKIFANVLSVLWEIISVFIGKLLYLLLMVFGAGKLYDRLPDMQVFLHILLFLTLIGGFANTKMFDPSKDKYYAMILMRMDAREYTLVNYAYAILKVVVGFLPLTILFGSLSGLPLWLCFALPFSIAGCKIAIAAASLWDYDRRGGVYNENKLNRYIWIGFGVLLGAAYGLPALEMTVPVKLCVCLMLSFIPMGAAGSYKIFSFQNYREINQELLVQQTNQMDTAAQITKAGVEKKISADTSISSNRKGFEYLNELFIKRHRRILWSATEKIACVCAVCIFGAMLILYLYPEMKHEAGKQVKNCLPYFTFIMYMINRGTGFTQALFMNCDHSLLTYSFYKEPKCILKLFQIRLREIMKINAVPGLIIGVGLALILYVSGGAYGWMDYGVLVISILCMSLFFSVHYLTIYYLLQPYNAGTEIKSGMYKVIMSVTYFCCFYMTWLRIPMMAFGSMMIVFCVVYSVIACVLVYRLAPKTFKIRS